MSVRALSRLSRIFLVVGFFFHLLRSSPFFAPFPCVRILFNALWRSEATRSTST